MSEEDVTKTETDYCPHAQDKMDCDGDWDTYCMKTGNCQYQKMSRTAMETL